MNKCSHIEDMPSMRDGLAEDSEVTQFYNDCNVLITGGSGFVGKLLIHKLLTSCPKLGKLLILMRPKRGKTPLERLQEIFEDPLYEKLHRDQPNFINRCTLIEGETSESDLGLSSSDRNFIIANTDIVIHGAATVRFDESLRKCIKINVRGVKLLLELAKKMTRLKAFVHLSTAFCHCYRDDVEEKYYEPPLSVDKALALIDIFDDDALDLLTPQLVGKFGNTYIFSKALSEEVVRLYSNGLPVCIVRPSIIVSTMYEPIRGWTDNIYGANGAVAFILHLAMLRTMTVDVSKIAEIIPADYVVNNIIVAAWGVNKQLLEAKYNTNESTSSASDVIVDEPPIYNCVSSCQNSLTWKEFLESFIKQGTEVISSKAMWYCVFYPTSNKWLYRIYNFFLHLVPAVIIDLLAILSGRKAKLYNATKKIQKFSESVAFACLKSWKYNNENVTKLWDRINSTDKKLFDFNVKNFDWNEFFISFTRGIRVYILKEPMSNLDESITRYKRLKLAHFTMVGMLFLMSSMILYSFPYEKIVHNFFLCVYANGNIKLEQI